MALVLDATPSGVASNTYSTRAEADAYHEAHISGTVWSSASTGTRDMALAHATRMLDSYIAWRGLRAVSGQALAFPRSGLYDPDTGDSISSATIPAIIKQACAEQARSLLAGDRAAELDATAQGLESMEVGSVRLAFRSGAAQEPLAPAVLGLLLPYLSSWGTVRPGPGGGPVALARR